MSTSGSDINSFRKEFVSIDTFNIPNKGICKTVEYFEDFKNIINSYVIIDGCIYLVTEAEQFKCQMFSTKEHLDVGLIVKGI